MAENQILEFLLAQNEEANKEPLTQYEAFYLKGKKDLIKELLKIMYDKEEN